MFSDLEPLACLSTVTTLAQAAEVGGIQRQVRVAVARENVVRVGCWPDAILGLALLTPWHVVKLPFAQPTPSGGVEEPVSLRSRLARSGSVLLAITASGDITAAWMVADYMLGLSEFFVGCHIGLPSFLFTSLWRSIAHCAKF